MSEDCGEAYSLWRMSVRKVTVGASVVTLLYSFLKTQRKGLAGRRPVQHGCPLVPQTLVRAKDTLCDELPLDHIETGWRGSC